MAESQDRIQTYELISEGMADSQHGRYAESVEKLTSALKDDPDSVPIHICLGSTTIGCRTTRSDCEL